MFQRSSSTLLGLLSMSLLLLATAQDSNGDSNSNSSNNNSSNDDDDDGLQGKTDKCNKFEFGEWISDAVACDAEADHRLNEVLASADFDDGELRGALCSSVAGRLKCRQDHLPECLSPRRTETVIHNFLVGEFRKAFNLTETLGEEVISGCPTLVRNEGKVLRVFAGSDRCTFRQVLGARIGLSECLQDARDEKDFRLRLLKLAPNPKDFFVNTWCRLRVRFVSCRLDLSRCLGKDQSKVFEDAETRFLSKAEELISRVLEDFSFATSCLRS